MFQDTGRSSNINKFSFGKATLPRKQIATIKSALGFEQIEFSIKFRILFHAFSWPYLLCFCIRMSQDSIIFDSFRLGSIITPLKTK